MVLRISISCVFYLFCIASPLIVVNGNLQDALHYYETLNIHDIQHRIVKRSVREDVPDVKQVEFQSLGKHFHLYLQRKHRTVASNMKIVAVDQYNNEEEVKIDVDNLYQGYSLDEPSTSHVSAYWDDDGSMTATINTKNDIYSIEPSWRHLPESSNHSMIAYKRKDMKFDDDNMGKSFCGYVDENLNMEDYYPKNQTAEHENEDSSRVKRQVTAALKSGPQKDACSLLLVADYRFFSNMGQRSLSKTASYLIGLVDKVDSIYRASDFGHHTKVGFEIKEIKIHKDPSVVASGGDHYNMKRDSWPTKELLEMFSRNQRFKYFCLAHLYTHLPFEGGVLGLAYIGSPRQYSVGGICSPVYIKGGHSLYLNTGWSSTLNRHNRRLLTQEANLVTTHEFGHNWGSEHDPDTSECSPGSGDGGKYIMYTYSVSGYDSNNKVFSPCSLRSMGAVLRAKADKCFVESKGHFCGNGRVEGDEECDAGHVKEDACCYSDCILRKGAQCSDYNDACCKNCQIQAMGNRCHESQNGSCDGAAYCDGKKKYCPPPSSKADGSPCLDKGACLNGTCQAFCTIYKKKSCICDKLAESCRYCCQEESGVCKTFNPDKGKNESFPLPDGMPCLQGTCYKGQCERQVQDLVERIWDVIENISPDKLVAFMRANIVGTVMALSLVIWIPASCVVSYIDRKRKREEDEAIEWHSHDNAALVLEKEQEYGRIRPSTRQLKRLPPLGAPQEYVARYPSSGFT